MSKWFWNWWTAHRLRVLLQCGWCPLCDSSPPKEDCYVCYGERNYGYKITELNRAKWSDRYVWWRSVERMKREFKQDAKKSRS